MQCVLFYRSSLRNTNCPISIPIGSSDRLQGKCNWMGILLFIGAFSTRIPLTHILWRLQAHTLGMMSGNYEVGFLNWVFATNFAYVTGYPLGPVSFRVATRLYFVSPTRSQSFLRLRKRAEK